MYSWIRSQGIIELIMPKYYSQIKIFVTLAPYFLFIQIISSTINQAFITVNDEQILKYIWLAHFICAVVAGITFLAADTLFISIFITYLRQARSEIQLIDEKFMIIAKYGIWAISLEYCAFFLLLLGMLVSNWTLANSLEISGTFCMNCVGMILVYIKMRIEKIPVASIRTFSGAEIASKDETSSETHTKVSFLVPSLNINYATSRRIIAKTEQSSK
ncbi:hypothetical protein BCR33DRAFT_328684 [Rhizoclosmatium globosum]|uniref:Uncharacterized protein n=1 Tax=Rhizoclosmatium globosum TaxID=329046 RepID=A0A1Y2C4I3_9FUNG|nr:hypothetical protein BCR33DRAFT_328684 [Rhizoclosmatium globosum]|eukprot:ORY41938.1 hypothetical protein BCR33DRAFT_328684 [Rhizoclosmatium globosum]